MGVHEGATENARVATSLLADLVDRGLSTDRPILFVIDGAKALRKAIRDVFGDAARVQRCQVHKRRNVLDHLPEQLLIRAIRRVSPSASSNGLPIHLITTIPVPRHRCAKVSRKP